LNICIKKRGGFKLASNSSPILVYRWHSSINFILIDETTRLIRSYFAEAAEQPGVAFTREQESLNLQQPHELRVPGVPPGSSRIYAGGIPLKISFR